MASEGAAGGTSCAGIAQLVHAYMFGSISFIGSKVGARVNFASAVAAKKLHEFNVHVKFAIASRSNTD